MEWRVLKWPDAPFLCRIEEERVGRVRGEKPAPVMSGLMMSRPDMLFVDHWSRSGEVSGAAARAPAPFSRIPQRQLFRQFWPNLGFRAWRTDLTRGERPWASRTSTRTLCWPC